MRCGWNRTKIVCTLGPATDPPGVIERLIGCGMNVARVNTSHGSHAEHADRIQRVRHAARECGEPVAILIDLPGPKFRIGDLPGGCCKLEEGAIITLRVEGGVAEADSDFLPVRDRELLTALRAGEGVFLADGSIELRVKTAVASEATCEVRIGGTVRSGSGINVPESALDALIPTEDDRHQLAFAISQEAEWVGISFVQSADDIARVRVLLPPSGAQPLLIAKIEKRKALANLEAIVQAADGVMVARGDLGVETDLARVPVVQKQIIAMANAWARPVITATQMLESMVEHEHATRAEVTDVANAVLDGTDAVMLSAETAIGAFPIAAVEMLQRVLAATEAEYGGRMTTERGHPGMSSSPDDALSFAACQLAARLGARAVIVPVGTLAAALDVARFRPRMPLVMISDSARLYRSLALVHGVAPLFPDAPAGGLQAHAAHAGEWLFAHGLAQPDDEAVLLSALGAADDAEPKGGTLCTSGKADTLQTIRLIPARV
ncbi:MAG: pyruvate kinase [Nitrosospira sp.]|nr:pyruvate kinase [Nitrosospira sp.]